MEPSRSGNSCFKVFAYTFAGFFLGGFFPNLVLALRSASSKEINSMAAAGVGAELLIVLSFAILGGIVGFVCATRNPLSPRPVNRNTRPKTVRSPQNPAPHKKSAPPRFDLEKENERIRNELDLLENKLKDQSAE